MKQRKHMRNQNVRINKCLDRHALIIDYPSYSIILYHLRSNLSTALINSQSLPVIKIQLPLNWTEVSFAWRNSIIALSWSESQDKIGCFAHGVVSFCVHAAFKLRYIARANESVNSPFARAT